VRINVEISLHDEQRVSSDEVENVSDDSSMQHVIQAKSSAERRFPFIGKSGLNIGLKDPSNTLEYFEFFVHQKLWKYE
jgi:hypothetical protein